MSEILEARKCKKCFMSDKEHIEKLQNDVRILREALGQIRKGVHPKFVVNRVIGEALEKTE